MGPVNQIFKIVLTPEFKCVFILSNISTKRLDNYFPHLVPASCGINKYR